MWKVSARKSAPILASPNRAAAMEAARLRSLATAMEAKDVLVFMVPRLPLAEMRGTAIAEREMPVILVNGQDRTGGRIFTLLHELPIWPCGRAASAVPVAIRMTRLIPPSNASAMRSPRRLSCRKIGCLVNIWCARKAA